VSNLQTILFVEDDPDIRLLASMALVEIGNFTLAEAQNGVEALAYLNNPNQPRPELILMDMMMPELDGIGALAQIKADNALNSIPVIFMTARVQPDEIKSYIDAGAMGVITKPFDPMTLVEQVNQLWEARA
jgi:CheY-like chemotaxis protein